LNALEPGELPQLLLAVSLLLAATQLCGALARWIGQPSVAGELAAGILLGPTLFGRLAPDLCAQLFPTAGGQATAFSVLTLVSIILFLAVAGLEVNLGRLFARLRVASAVGVAGIVVPFTIGFGAAYAWPRLLGAEGGVEPLVFALFMGTALAISALPVIAKTLVDLDLYRTDLGALVIGSAVFNDLIGWTLFGLVVGSFRESSPGIAGMGAEIAITVVTVGMALTVGRALALRSLRWIDRGARDAGGVIAFVVCAAFASAALTESVGHGALMGAFLAGVVMGGTIETSPRRLGALERLVAVVFAPLFFGSLGLRTDFVANFDPELVLVVFAIACLGKVLGCGLAARWSGLPASEAWAVGFGMNARGAMEMAMALVALQYQIISERLFVALVVMALATSAMSGPLMKRLIPRSARRRFLAHLDPRTFRPVLLGQDRAEAIRGLSQATAAVAHLDPAVLAEAVLAREAIMSTGVGQGIAIPHARMPGLAAPVVAIGISNAGVDFGAPDGELASLIVLVVTPEHDDLIQIELMAEIARTFQHGDTRRAVAHARTFEELSEVLRDAPGMERRPA
jgi:Kef-type K+ transport system membrane component KefB/mannitol/fructose-specific phosphotransferase system IIA component (Ntr-type)